MKLLLNEFYFGDLMFQIVPIFIGIIFIIVITMILFTLIKGLGQWRKNDKSPRLSVPVTIVSKRTSVRGGDHTHTSYYVTFEFESGDRTELMLAANEYGLLAEGDSGILMFQGTRYIGFERQVD